MVYSHGDAPAAEAVMKATTRRGHGRQPWAAVQESLLEAPAVGVGEVALVAGPDGVQALEVFRCAAQAVARRVGCMPLLQLFLGVAQHAAAYPGVRGVHDVAEEVDAGKI